MLIFHRRQDNGSVLRFFESLDLILKKVINLNLSDLWWQWSVLVWYSVELLTQFVQGFSENIG